MKIKNLLIAVFVIATAMISGCGKDGATGPQGPAGADGNANVQVVSFTIPYNQWVTNSNGWEIDATYTSSGIDFSGSVLCYYSPDDQNWNVLPWTSLGDQPYFEQIFTFNTVTGVFDIEWSNITPNSTSAPYPPEVAYFKIVSIPPSLLVKHPYTNWKDYNQVKAIMDAQSNVSANKKLND